jgi:hypothetical protein
MKRILLTISLATTAVVMHAQHYDYQQMDTSQMHNQPILNVEKAKFLKDVNFIANTRFAFNNDFLNGTHTNSNFALDEFRMEFVGKVGDRVHFRFRQFLSVFPSDIQERDQVRQSVDLAEIGYDINDKFNLTLGKMLSEWGSYELENNPINIVAFNDLILFSDPFLTGVRLRYKMMKNHTLTLQVVNTRTQNLTTAMNPLPAGVETSTMPLGVNFSWRGRLLDGKFNTIYSVSNFVEAQGKSVQLIQLGNEFRLGKLTLEYDFKFSNDQIDRLGQVSSIIQPVNPTRALDVRYMEHWLRAVYFFHKDWSITGIGMTNQNYWLGNELAPIAESKTDLLRTAFSYTILLEYYAYWPQNLRFFAGYVSRNYNYSDYAQAQFVVSDFNTGKLLFGVITPLVFY